MELVSWQEDEVAWGSFVPYNVVEVAADRSIARLVATNDWPGRHPPFQSHRRGDAPEDETFTSQVVGDWTNWDFVPDGLLVWEAWVRAIQKH